MLNKKILLLSLAATSFTLGGLQAATGQSTTDAAPAASQAKTTPGAERYSHKSKAIAGGAVAITAIIAYLYYKSTPQGKAALQAFFATDANGVTWLDRVKANTNGARWMFVKLLAAAGLTAGGIWTAINHGREWRKESSARGSN